MDQIIEKAKELGELLKQSEQYKSYQVIKAEYEADSELQKLIGEFNLKKMAVMNEMQKEENSDGEKLKALQDDMRKAYAAAMSNGTMTKYMKTKEIFENMVNDMYSIINYAITGVKSNGCDGSHCDSCGGCHD